MFYVKRRRLEDQSIEELLRHTLRLDLVLYLIIFLALLGCLLLPPVGLASPPVPHHRRAACHHQRRHHDRARRHRGRCAGADAVSLGEGPRGYKDWQRVVSWDDGALIVNESGTEHTGNFTQPARLEVGRFAYLMGRIGVTLQPCVLVLRWWDAKAGGSQLGERRMQLTPTNTPTAQLHIPNLGPWLEISYENQAGETYAMTAHLILSNRVHPLELIPSVALLLREATPFVGAESRTIYPSTYYAGPARLFVNKEAQALEIALETENGPGTWVLFDFHTVAGGLSVEGFNVLLPLGAWRVTLTSAGAQSFGITLTPSLTGST